MGLTVNFRSGSNGPLELRLSELVAELPDGLGTTA